MNRQELDGMLADVKSLSELMVDLAYGALLMQDDDLSDEVHHLEETVDRFTNQVQVAAAHLVESQELDPIQAVAMMRLAQASEQVADAARDLANLVARDMEAHPVLRAVVEDSDVVLRRIRVRPGSLLDGRTLSEAHLETETGWHVFALRRGDSWLLGPTSDLGLASDDMLLARGPPEGVAGLLELAGHGNVDDGEDWDEEP